MKILSKSVLTLDDINLLKNSEEPKNTELYGNLYQVLCSLTNSKAVTIEQLSLLDDKGKAALTYNKKNLIDAVIKEWYAERVSEEDSSKKIRCGLCNTPNKYLYYIRNRNNNIVLNVGSSCITKFPGIEGFVKQKQQLKQIQKEHEIIKRRTEFYNDFPDVEKFIAEADKYFSNFPFLLPYHLYVDLQDNIKQMRLIYSKYINEGKCDYKNQLTPIELFKQKAEKYEELKLKAEVYKVQYKDKSLVCKRKEIDWMLIQGKNELLKQIAENSGIYTLETLQQINSIDFVEKHLDTFFSKNKSMLLKIEKIDDNNLIIFSFTKSGYQKPILFAVKISEFMYNVGAKCLINKDYTYGNSEIRHIARIINSIDNLYTIIDYIYDFLIKFNCVFLFDDTTNKLILYRKLDRAIRSFSYNDFINNYNKYVFLTDNDIKQYLFLVVKGKNTTKWITADEQIKQGINEKITKLFKEQYPEEYSSDLYYNKSDKDLEVITYHLIQSELSGDFIINYNNPEYIKFPKSKIKAGDAQLKNINYAIHITSDSFEPFYHKDDVVFIQDTKNIANESIIFFEINNKLRVKKCSTEEPYANIFGYLNIRKNQLQSYGKVVCSLE